jgi:flagellar hook-basal body complex protein FliE
MSYFKISNNNHSIATDFYQRAAKNIEKTNDLNKIQDIISVKEDKKFDLGGVKTVIAVNNKVNDTLLAGDKILVSEIESLDQKRKKDSFMRALEQKFKSLLKSEETSRSAVNQEATLLELTSSIKEAEQSLDFLVSCRDKLVNLWKDLLNTAI